MSRPGDKHWTETEVARLRATYPTTDTQKIASALGKTPDAVRTKALRLKLYKVEESLPQGLKRCPRCQQIKQLDTDFWPGQSWCKRCQREKADGWAKENRPRLARYYRVRVSRNPEKMQAIAARSSHRQRALLKDGHDLTEDQWQSIIENQKHRCALCGDLFSESEPPVRDCIVPVSKGGRLTVGNVQSVHAKCNGRKGARLPSANPPRPHR